MQKNGSPIGSYAKCPLTFSGKFIGKMMQKTNRRAKFFAPKFIVDRAIHGAGSLLPSTIRKYNNEVCL
jgi:hypothetical protein